MKLVVGSYRGMKLLPDTLKEIGKYVSGVTQIIIVDDSPSGEVSKYYQSAPVTVVPLGGVGCHAAMEVVRNIMKTGKGPGFDSFGCFWEEDCVPIKEINLQDFAIELNRDPLMVQIAFGRQPTFPEEVEAGSVARFLAGSDAFEFEMVGGSYSFIKQDRVFTGNPSIWSPPAWQDPWPQVPGHEAIKTTELKGQGYYFGYTVEQLIDHLGEREGHGY